MRSIYFGRWKRGTTFPRSEYNSTFPRLFFTYPRFSFTVYIAGTCQSEIRQSLSEGYKRREVQKRRWSLFVDVCDVPYFLIEQICLLPVIKEMTKAWIDHKRCQRMGNDDDVITLKCTRIGVDM